MYLSAALGGIWFRTSIIYQFKVSVTMAFFFGLFPKLSGLKGAAVTLLVIFFLFFCLISSFDCP